MKAIQFVGSVMRWVLFLPGNEAFFAFCSGNRNWVGHR